MIAPAHWAYILLFLLCGQCLAGSDSPYGQFLFPTKSQAETTFNYLDTLNVTWESYAPNFTSPCLMLWLTTGLAPNFKQILVFNSSVPTNGTLSVPLNYGGAFNLSNFNLQQGPINNPNSSFYSSGQFNIQKVDGIPPQTWGTGFQAAATQPTPSSPANIILPTSTLSIPLATTSTPGTKAPAPNPTSPSLPPRILAPLLTLLILFFLGALFLSVFLVRKRRRYNALLLQYQTVMDERGNAQIGRHAVATEKDALREELEGSWQGYELDACPEKAQRPAEEPDRGEGEEEGEGQNNGGGEVNELRAGSKGSLACN